MTANALRKAFKCLMDMEYNERIENDKQEILAQMENEYYGTEFYLDVLEMQVLNLWRQFEFSKCFANGKAYIRISLQFFFAY